MPTIRKAQISDLEWLAEHVRDWLSEPDNLIAFGPDEIAGVADHQCKLLKDSIRIATCISALSGIRIMNHSHWLLKTQ